MAIVHCFFPTGHVGTCAGNSMWSKTRQLDWLRCWPCSTNSVPMLTASGSELRLMYRGRHHQHEKYGYDGLP